MRWLGVSRRAFDMLCERAVSKSVHGSPLADKQTIQNWVADSRAEIEATRLMTLHAAWKIDQVGAKAARNEIAMIKYHGRDGDATTCSTGRSRSTARSASAATCRWRRCTAARVPRGSTTGPTRSTGYGVARRILRGYEPRETPTEHVPTRRAAAQAKFAHLLDTASVN